jgi:hypothetical protein
MVMVVYKKELLTHSSIWEGVRHNSEECKIYHYEKDFYHHFRFVLLSWAVGKG